MSTTRQSCAFAITNLVILIGLPGCVLAAHDAPTRFKVTTKRDTDRVEVTVNKDQAVFLLDSPTGISDAVIERMEERWPETVTLRLHLKGLESFRASNGKVTLDAAVSSHNGGPRVRLWQDGKENMPLEPKSPLSMEIRLIGGDGKPATDIPLKDGYFELQLPKGRPKNNFPICAKGLR